jgi:transposase
MDTSKHIFQLHGVNAAEEPVLRKKLRRKDMIAFFAGLEPVEIAIEACGASHHWHLDEVFVKINGERHYLWRAVGHEGEVLEGYVTKRHDKAAALAFLK